MNKLFIKLIQLLLVIVFIISWELLSKYNVINSFIFSSPSKVIKCIIDLYRNNDLTNHILITLKEVIISFSLSIIIAFIISIIFYEFKIVYKILEPFLTMINSTPKIALGPLIIILFGAGFKSIIIMSLSITLFINITSIYNGFLNTNEYLVKLLDSYGAGRILKIKYIVIPSAIKDIIYSLKTNISMTLVGVIMGEFLVSKAGLGYLVIYGTQIFNLTLVISCIMILVILSYLLFIIIDKIENKIKNTP